MALGYVLTMREIVEYYTERDDIQRVLVAHGARRRTIIGTDAGMFGRRGGTLSGPEQIGQMLRSVADQNLSTVPRKYPAFHSCITCMPANGRAPGAPDGAAWRSAGVGFVAGGSGVGAREPQASECGRDGSGTDIVIDIDIKTDQQAAFKQGRKVLDVLESFGVPYRVKFSGNSSPHIILPADLFPPEVCGPRFNQLGQRLIGFITSKAGATNVDGSFSSPDHYLRMPYSLNENTGLVSVPIPPEEYNTFRLEMAEAQSVVVRDNWFSVAGEPTDGVQALLSAAGVLRGMVSR